MSNTTEDRCKTKVHSETWKLYYVSELVINHNVTIHSGGILGLGPRKQQHLKARVCIRMTDVCIRMTEVYKG